MKFENQKKKRKEEEKEKKQTQRSGPPPPLYRPSPPHPARGPRSGPAAPLPRPAPLRPLTRVARPPLRTANAVTPLVITLLPLSLPCSRLCSTPLVPCRSAVLWTLSHHRTHQSPPRAPQPSGRFTTEAGSRRAAAPDPLSPRAVSPAISAALTPEHARPGCRAAFNWPREPSLRLT